MSSVDQLLLIQDMHPRTHVEDALLTLCAAMFADIQELKSDVASLEYQVSKSRVAR